MIGKVSGQPICSGKNVEDMYLDEPRPLPEPMQSKFVRDLGGVHGIWEILLIGKDKE